MRFIGATPISGHLLKFHELNGYEMITSPMDYSVGSCECIYPATSKNTVLENHDFYMLETLKHPSSTIVDGSTSVKSLLNSHYPPSVTIKARFFPWFFSLHHEIPAWPRFFGHKHCHPKVMWPLSPKSGQGLVSCCPRRGSVALGLQQVFVGNVLPFFCILVFPTKWGNDPFDTCS